MTSGFLLPFFLIGGDTVTINDTATNGIAVLTNGVTGVSFHGIDRPVFHSFDNSYMVGHAIAFPIEKDDITWQRNTTSWFPLLMFPERGIEKRGVTS